MPVETEIKLRLRDGVGPIREKLAQLGFVEASPRELEVDQVFDLPGQPLRLTRKLLRVRRRGSECILTYKGPPTPGPHKSREEIETAIGDGAAFETVLERLGYQRTFRYENFRTKFVSAEYEKAGIILLDETPIGCFLELEGSGSWIDATAEYLGFSADQYITRSYAALYLEHSAATPGASADMTF